MQIAKILNQEAVRVLGAASSKKRLFQEIADVAQAAHRIEPGAAVDALLERESLGPTGVGHGVALPHARIEGIERVLGVFVALEKPLDFGSVDRQPVDLVFALFAPVDAGVEHLKALALVSRTLREQSFCTKLRANTDPATLFTILTEGQSVKAA